jgi:hypothetical protein
MDVSNTEPESQALGQGSAETDDWVLEMPYLEIRIAEFVDGEEEFDQAGM